MELSWGKRVCGALMDNCMCLFVFFPLAVFHWRGTWHLQDVYLFPNQYAVSSWSSAVIGSVLSVCLILVHPFLARALHALPRWLYVLGIRLYLYLSAWAILGYWRGFWNLLDYYLTDHWLNSLILYVAAGVVSLGLRTTRTNAGLPLSLQIDIDEDLLRPDTRFSTEPSSHCLYFLDILFTQYVVVSLNILVWRGLWNLIYAFVFPGQKLVSDLFSLILGYATCIIFFLLEYPMSRASARLDEHHLIFKLVYEGMVMVTNTWSVLLLWRGAWNLVREYVIPDRRVGGWVCHVVGVVGLMALQGYSNVATNGIDIDGTYKNGQGIYPTEYIRHFLWKNKSQVKYSELKNVPEKINGTSKTKNNYDADSESSDSDLENEIAVENLQKSVVNGVNQDGSPV